MRLLLFDIDGTLLLGNGVGMRAMALAFHERFGIDDTFSDIEPHGKTDPLIFREILRSRSLVGGGDEDRLVAEISSMYERYLRREMPRSSARLLPGVQPLLEALSQRPGVLLGLLTGNLEPTARVKPRHLDIDHFFAFGAFASDAEMRSQLVPIAVDRAREHSGFVLPAHHVLVIGDTPLDVACALDNGVTAVAVAGAHDNARQLREAGAHLVLDDLIDTERVAARLLSRDARLE